jgi:hypothetical protein
MDIVFACPRCQHVMQVAGEQAGSRTKCIQCSLPLEVPFPKGQLVDVRPSELGTGAALAAPAVAPAAARSNSPIAPTSRSGTGTIPINRSTPMPPSAPSNSTAGQLKADELFKQASAHKDQGDLDGAIRLLRDAYDRVCRANAMFPVEDFLRLPIYLQMAGRSREAWQEFNDLLFQGYPNQTKDISLIAKDRAKIFDKMRLLLEADGQAAIADVFGVFCMVCKGISLHYEGRTRELKTWFNKQACSDFVRTLKKFKGNLGKLQGIQYAVIAELDEYPAIDFDLLAQRIDVTLRG